MYVTAADAYKKKSTYFDGSAEVGGAGAGGRDCSLIAGRRYRSRFAPPGGQSGSVRAR